MTELTIHHHHAEDLLAMREEVLSVYRQVYADQLSNPFQSPERFWERLAAYASRDRFGMVAGTIDGHLVGFALGYPLPEHSRWWAALRGQHQDDHAFTREDGHRTFGFNELMVHPAWRGHGFGRTLHNALLASRPEERASLLVRPDNELARAAYLRWGWQVVGTIKPFPDSPTFEALVRLTAPTTKPPGI